MDEEPDDGDWRPTQLLRRRPDMARMTLSGRGATPPTGARSPGGLGPGDRIFHRKFGYGVVRDELARMEAPDAVRDWIQAAPAWLEVRSDSVSSSDDASLESLDDGEKAALALAANLISAPYPRVAST